MSDRIALPTDLDAVFLDAGGVLIIPDLDGIIARHELDIEPDALLTAFFAANDLPGQPEGEDNHKHQWLWRNAFDILGFDANSDVFEPFLTGC